MHGPSNVSCLLNPEVLACLTFLVDMRHRGDCADQGPTEAFWVGHDARIESERRGSGIGIWEEDRELYAMCSLR